MGEESRGDRVRKQDENFRCHPSSSLGNTLLGLVVRRGLLSFLGWGGGGMLTGLRERERKDGRLETHPAGKKSRFSPVRAPYLEVGRKSCALSGQRQGRGGKAPVEGGRRKKEEINLHSFGLSGIGGVIEKKEGEEQRPSRGNKGINSLVLKVQTISVPQWGVEESKTKDKGKGWEKIGVQARYDRGTTRNQRRTRRKIRRRRGGRKEKRGLKGGTAEGTRCRRGNAPMGDFSELRDPLRPARG